MIGENRTATENAGIDSLEEMILEDDAHKDGRPDDYEELAAHMYDEMSEEERGEYFEIYSESMVPYYSGVSNKKVEAVANEEEHPSRNNLFEEPSHQFSIYRSWPPPDSLAPRNRDTYDGLFFALLSRAALDASTVEEFRNKADHSSAFLLRSGTQLYYPLSREPFKDTVPAGRLVILRRSTAIANFFRAWTAVRREVNRIALEVSRESEGHRAVNRYDGMIEIGDVWCSESSFLDETELASFLESSGIPCEEGKSAWNSRRAALLSQLQYSDAPSPKDDQLLCPFCGPIRPLCVKLSSPSWTWERMVGRGSDHLCCPSCLGDFGTVAIRVN